MNTRHKFQANFISFARPYFADKNVEKMRKTVFPMLIAVCMVMLAVTSVSVSANVSVLVNEQSYKLPLKGFVSPLQWNRENSPDLVVYDNEITFNPTSPMPGESVKITATIHNEGDTSARRGRARIKVGFYDGSPSAETLIGTTNIGYILAGASITTSISWTAIVGTHVIYVVADPDGTISESDEDNNVAHNTVIVGEPAPDENPPNVSIVDPVNDQTVWEETYRIIVSAADAEGEIATVEVSIDSGAWIDITTNIDGTHYYYDWITSEGTHRIDARATDDSSNTGFADQVMVTVDYKAPILGEKWAVLIGIADYQGRRNDLWHTDEDAKDMETVLSSLYGFQEDHMKILLNREATVQAILDAIDWLDAQEKSTDDIVVFFFSGHGYSSPEDEWENTDDIYEFEESDNVDEFIVSYDLWAYADGFLAQKFAAFDSDNVFLWFGSCHSGGMEDIAYAPSFSGVICTACLEDQYGFDVYRFGNTLFGEYYIDQGILKGLGDGHGPYGADDGVVTVEEAFYYAAPLVAAWAEQNTDYSSEPQIFDTDPATDFYL